MNKISSGLFVLGLSLPFLGMAEETFQYKVLSGEVLSTIADKFLPNVHTYGKKGKLKKIIKLNQKLKSSDHIFPGNIIRLPLSFQVSKTEILPLKIEVAVEPPNPPALQVEAPVKSKPALVGYNLMALFGVKHLSYDQTGILNSANLKGSFFNYLSVASEFSYNDFKTNFAFETYKINYTIPDNLLSGSFFNIESNISWKWISANLGLEQIPITANQNETLTLYSQKILYLGLGARYDFNIDAFKTILVSLKAEYRYPVKAFSINSDLASNSLTGYHVNGQINFKTEILKRESFTMSAVFNNSIGLQKVSEHIVWGTADGIVNSTVTTVNNALGVVMDF